MPLPGTQYENMYGHFHDYCSSNEIQSQHANKWKTFFTAAIFVLSDSTEKAVSIQFYL